MKKKFIIIVSIIVLFVLVVGGIHLINENRITSNNDVINDINEVQTDEIIVEELVLKSNDGMNFKLNADMSTISKEPISELEGRGDGFHWKEYTYEDIFVKALIVENNSTNIILISTDSNKYKTPRGVKVGDSLPKLQETYSDDLSKANSDEICYVYEPQEVGFNRIYFYIENDIITKIMLENGIDG